MDRAAAEETQELLEVQQEEAAAEGASDPEPDPIPDPPETVIGLIHEQGALAALVTQLSDRADGLENSLSALRAEMAGIARIEAEHLLDTILAEAQSGEAGEAATQPQTPHNPSWWEKVLGGA